MLAILAAFAAADDPFAADFNFRVHNADGWTGPRTSFEGNNGYCLLLEETTNIAELLKSDRTRPEVIVMPLNLLSDANMNLIQDLYKPRPYLQGVVVLNVSTASVCHDVPFPNADQSYYPSSEYVWNEHCDGMVSKVYDFPIIFPTYKETQTIINHIKNAGDKAGIYIRVFMQSDGSDETCIEDDHCKPIGGLSMFGGFQENYVDEGVWVVSSYDSYGLFPYASVAADYSISGFVAVIAALDSMKGVDWSTATKPLRFAFFDAEEVGYVGSQMFLKDIQGFSCSEWEDSDSWCSKPYRTNWQFRNVKLEDIGTVVEMKQVAKASVVYAHGMTDLDGEDTFLDNVVSFDSAIKKSKVGRIPPSSTNAFLKAKKDIKHVVLTGFDDKYPADNKYGSPGDDQYDVDAIANAAESLAKVLAGLTGVTRNNVVNRTIVEELMLGFVHVPSQSKLMNELFPGSELPTDHVALYSGVYARYTYNLKQQVVRNLLKDAIAYNVTEHGCSSDSSCNWLNTTDHTFLCSANNKCEAVRLDPHPAYSNAYEYVYEDDKYEMKDTKSNYPRAAEANWLTPDMRLVTLPAPLTGRVTLGCGIVICMATTALMGWFWGINIAKLKSV